MTGEETHIPHYLEIFQFPSLTYQGAPKKGTLYLGTNINRIYLSQNKLREIISLWVLSNIRKIKLGKN